jgi:hypothetical protein
VSGVKRPGREVEHSPPSSAEINNPGGYIPLSHTSLRSDVLLSIGYDFEACCLVKYRNTLIKFERVATNRHPHTGQKQNIRKANKQFENTAKFKYLGTTLTNQNDIHDEIKSKLNSGNTCYHSIQDLLSSRLISKNLKIKI